MSPTLEAQNLESFNESDEEKLKDKTETEEKDGQPKRNRSRHRSGVRNAKGSNVQLRSALSENYEHPVSAREQWWRSTMKETPAPGAYEIPADFINELEKKPNTYRFRSDGRKVDPMPHIGSGQYLLPGAYNSKNRTMSEDLSKSRVTYCFKDTGRGKRDFLNFGKKDKDVNIPPNVYNTEKYLTLTCDKHASKYWQFKSQSRRFPTIQFKPRTDDPAPGQYESFTPQPKHAVSSSFMSKTPRFVTSHTKTPGPGTYERIVQSPMPKTVMKMGRQHGVFFSSAFQT